MRQRLEEPASAYWPLAIFSLQASLSTSRAGPTLSYTSGRTTSWDSHRNTNRRSLAAGSDWGTNTLSLKDGLSLAPSSRVALPSIGHRPSPRSWPACQQAEFGPRSPLLLAREHATY